MSPSTCLDAHVYIGRSIQGFGQDVSQVLAGMDRLTIERVVLVPVRPLGYEYRSQNELVAGARRDHPERIYALGRVDPRQPGAASEAERCLGELELQGIYIHPWEDATSVVDRRLDPIIDVCAHHSAPLVVAAGYPLVAEAAQIGDLASRHPNVSVVMTNGGQINISGLGQQSAMVAMHNCSNLYMTTSGCYREDFIEEVVESIGPERVLFGSQSPLFDQDFELHRILWAHTTEEARHAVMWGNAQRLFGAES